MNRLNFAYNHEELQPFVARLNKDYYDVINGLCEIAKKQANKLRELEVHQSASQYVILCCRLIEEIEQHIKARKESFIPYAMKLAEKESDDHDCANCKGGGACNLQHEMHLVELKESHNRIKDILYRLQMVALPLYSETLYPDVYRVLRNQMALLENALTELFFIEDAYLIPKVIETQKKIHADSHG